MVAGHFALSSAQDCAWLIAESANSGLLHCEDETTDNAIQELLKIRLSDQTVAVSAATSSHPRNPQMASPQLVPSSGNRARTRWHSIAQPKPRNGANSTTVETKSSLLQLLTCRADTSGIVIAMPHGGPLLAAARDLVGKTRISRSLTFTIDQSVADHLAASARSVFDEMFELLSARSVIEVTVLDNAGARFATRRLRDGGVVVILADIVSDLRHSVSVPWFEGARCVMRGAAWLSLSGNAALVAAAPVHTTRNQIEVYWQAIGDPDVRYRRTTTSYLLTLELWKAFEQLAERGATQLREGYEAYRPAPLRELFVQIRTQQQLLRTIEALINPHPVIIDQSPGLRLLLEGLRASGDAGRGSYQ